MSLEDLRVPPSNRLEALARDPQGQHSIRIHKLWTLCFVFGKDGAEDVEISKHYERGGGQAMSIRIEDLAKRDSRSVTVAGGKRISPTPPGEMLRDEFLKPMGLTNYRLAKEIVVPAQRIGDIIAGKRGITADTDLRLCRFFGLTEGWWLRLQGDHEWQKR
jgi:antitoxin HigA-1